MLVPHYAMSGGTLLAMAADPIVMDDNAVLGPVDPQLGRFPAASILKVVEQKKIDEVDDQTLIMADVSRKAIRQVKQVVIEILASNDVPREKAEAIAEKLRTGTWTHDYPISVAEASGLGLPITTEMPREVYQLMNLYPQAASRRPARPSRPSMSVRGLWRTRRPARPSRPSMSVRGLWRTRRPSVEYIPMPYPAAPGEDHKRAGS